MEIEVQDNIIKGLVTVVQVVDAQSAINIPKSVSK